MLPPKKKRRVDTDVADATMTDGDAEEAVSTPTVSSPPTLAALDRLLDQFTDSLEDFREASSILLNIKSFQREVLQQLATTEESLAEEHTKVERHHTTLANLKYEQGHWESKIQHIEATSKTPQLEALCREELDDNLSDTTKVIEKFVGQDISSHEHQKQQVIHLLHNQIHERGTLERDVLQKNKELLNKQGIQKKRAQFLQQLPDKLKAMESASLPLQRFFAAASAAADKDSGLTKIGAAKFNTSDRDTRLQLARNLAGPLYTLLVQLQSYLDDYPHKNMSLDVANISALKVSSSAAAASSVWKDPHEKVVLWQIPIPNVQAGAASASTTSSTKTKFVTIGFVYFEKLQVVTAKVLSHSGEDKLLDVSTLLQYHPQDSGNYHPEQQQQQVQEEQEEDSKPASSSEDAIMSEADGDKQEEEQEAVKKPTFVYGKPFLWCNYLAGLQLVKGEDPQEINKQSTRAIVANLLRHIRANAILHYLLTKVLPSHPRFSSLPPASDASQCLAKVSLFQLDKNNNKDDTSTKTYKVHCKRGNHSLQASVTVNPALYPALVAPVWSLTASDVDWGQQHGSQEALDGTNAASAPPLHESRLFAIQGQVNNIDALIEKLQKKAADGEDALEEDEKESFYYDWILTHQLREILVEWDDWVTTSSGEEGAGAAGRTVRGRDRAKVE
ncbi:Tho complex [Seminavis robusta]|uniref:Tho complex n=1 Tax=Seminavis robusta TaxID=568900 RepID=A0A9N8DNX0_9STRA|nr:Tho complex [Seminavis robusta]|eukprot:Sro184_g079820.1 Tho complex (674) ;mRNA; f:11446-13467